MKDSMGKIAVAPEKLGVSDKAGKKGAGIGGSDLAEGLSSHKGFDAKDMYSPDESMNRMPKGSDRI